MNGDGQQPPLSSGWQYKPGDPDPQSVDTSSMAQTPQPQPEQPDAVYQAPAPATVPQTAVPSLAPQHPEVSWAALEFVAQEKSPLWYLVLIVITLGIASVLFFLSHDKISTTLIIIIGIIFGVSAGRKPRTMQYLLDSKGITINRAFRPYAEFKSFALVQEGELDTILFLPLKRFTLPLSLNVTPDESNEVVTKLSDYLPNDQAHGHDAIDHFVQRIHF